MAALVAGCGEGELTPEPSGSEAPPSFAWVQAEVLTPSCGFSTCHGSGAGSGGLRLSEGDAWGALVGVASQEVPSILRVTPGDPDASYLVWKLEGAEGIVDDAMPPPNGGLPEEKVAGIRAWIAAGASDEP